MSFVMEKQSFFSCCSFHIRVCRDQPSDQFHSPLTAFSCWYCLQWLGQLIGNMITSSTLNLEFEILGVNIWELMTSVKRYDIPSIS